MRSRFPGALFVTLAVVAMLVVVPPAEAGNPVLEFLENMIQPMLNTIQSGLTASNRTLESIQIQGSNLLDKIDQVKFTVVGMPKAVTVTSSFFTHENSVDGVNLDPDELPLTRIRRYTVTVHTTALSAAPEGTCEVEINTAVFDGVALNEVVVSATDPAGRGALGIVERPFTGTNTLIRVRRGNDGLGARKVTYSAYIEFLP